MRVSWAVLEERAILPSEFSYTNWCPQIDSSEKASLPRSCKLQTRVKPDQFILHLPKHATNIAIELAECSTFFFCFFGKFNHETKKTIISGSWSSRTERRQQSKSRGGSSHCKWMNCALVTLVRSVIITTSHSDEWLTRRSVWILSRIKSILPFMCVYSHFYFHRLLNSSLNWEVKGVEKSHPNDGQDNHYLIASTLPDMMEMFKIENNQINKAGNKHTCAAASSWPVLSCQMNKYIYLKKINSPSWAWIFDERGFYHFSHSFLNGTHKKKRTSSTLNRRRYWTREVYKSIVDGKPEKKTIR